MPVEYSPKDIDEMDLKTAYSVYCRHKHEDKNPKRYLKIRYGDKITFDINDAILNLVVHKVKAGIFIFPRKKVVEASDLFSELEVREALIKNALIEMIDNDTIVEERK